MSSGAVCQIYVESDHSVFESRLENELCRIQPCLYQIWSFFNWSHSGNKLWSHMPDLYEIWSFFNWISIRKWALESCADLYEMWLFFKRISTRKELWSSQPDLYHIWSFPNLTYQMAEPANGSEPPKLQNPLHYFGFLGFVGHGFWISFILLLFLFVFLLFKEYSWASRPLHPCLAQL